MDRQREWICLCRGVHGAQICAAVAAGARTVDAVATTCGAGSDCGSCRPAIAALITSTIRSRRSSVAA